MCTSQGYRGFKSLSLRQRESLLPCMATGFLRAQKRARQKPVRLRQRLFPLREKDHRNNVTRLGLAAINRCSVAALLLLTNPSLCAKSTPKRGVFSLLRRFYAEFLVFRFPKLCTRMRVNSEGNFYIAVPCEALANIHIYAALRTTCNKGMPQVVEFVSGAKRPTQTAEEKQAAGAEKAVKGLVSFSAVRALQTISFLTKYRKCLCARARRNTSKNFGLHITP